MGATCQAARTSREDGGRSCKKSRCTFEIGTSDGKRCTVCFGSSSAPSPSFSSAVAPSLAHLMTLSFSGSRVTGKRLSCLSPPGRGRRDGSPVWIMRTDIYTVQDF